MKIELKNIKHAAFASQETHCYSANLYVDGKKYAHVSNDGHGGADRVEWFVDANRAGQVKDWLYENGNHSEFNDGRIMREDLEMRCCSLINEWIEDREAKKAMRKITYVAPDRNGILTVYNLSANIKPTAENIAKVQDADWWSDDHQMLNGMAFADFKARFFEVIESRNAAYRGRIEARKS